MDLIAPLNKEAQTLISTAMTELNLSARAYDKIRRVSLTISDISESDEIDISHVAEAIQYRLLDRQLTT